MVLFNGNSDYFANDEPRIDPRKVLAERVTILYTLSQHYLFLPFAALCMTASLVHQSTPVALVSLPVVLLFTMAVFGTRLKAAYERRKPGDDPAKWGLRQTTLSGAIGTVWGIGAIIWFVPGSFAAQAYLSLAFLGMTTGEFISRSIHRPAYLAHASMSLGPLAVMLFLEGDLYAMLTCVLVLFYGGALHGFAGHIRTLLDQSIRLRFTNAGLVERLQEEKLAVEAARDAAEASARSKSVFIANISHEIRTPLNAMLGMTQILERSELDRAQRDHVKVLLEAGRGLRTLLDDVIEMSQEETPKDVPSDGADAGQAVRTVARLLQPSAWERRLRLTVNTGGHLPRAAADPRQLRRVLLKLADNALKFTERGGVTIAVEPANLEGGQTALRFSVTDTGPGLPPDIANQIFEPFAPGSGAYSRGPEGAGLGLAVAKRVVESLGGEIGYTSEPGEGTHFWFTVPAVASQQHKAPAPIAEQSTPPSGQSLLILTTKEDDREVFDKLIATFGNRTSFVASPAEAAEEAARGDYDAIIAEAAFADAIAASPGVRAPVVALIPPGGRVPSGAAAALTWPGPASELYRAIEEAAPHAKNADAKGEDASRPAASIDALAFVALEKSLGLATLIEILQSYMKTAEDLSASLAKAADDGKWEDVGRLAQDIAGAAGGLGLAALTTAARGLAQATREGGEPEALKARAEDIVAEHRRVRDALEHLYPDLAA